MYKNSTNEIPYDEIDFEIVDICKILNSIDGIETIESCVGHGEYPCCIWFKCKSIQILNRLIFYCFNHESHWKIQLDTSDPCLTWGDIHCLLTTEPISDEYVVSLMIDSLYHRIIKYISEVNNKEI